MLPPVNSAQSFFAVPRDRKLDVICLVVNEEPSPVCELNAYFLLAGAQNFRNHLAHKQFGRSFRLGF